jgi:hypothetical protein
MGGEKSGGGVMRFLGGERARALAPYAAVAAAVLVAFSPSLDGNFLRWDDDRLASQNPLVGPPYLEHTLEMFSGVRQEAY